MEPNKISGILSIILGLIFIIFPIFSTAALSILIGVSLIFFGIALVLSGFTALNIVIGVLTILVGLVFAFNIQALSVLFALQFYVIGILMIIADHGNCDMMWDSNHLPVTSHTTNPVPCIVTKKGIELSDGKLADVAPTMLKLLGMDIPDEMTGDCLIK